MKQTPIRNWRIVFTDDHEPVAEPAPDLDLWALEPTPWSYDPDADAEADFRADHGYGW